MSGLFEAPMWSYGLEELAKGFSTIGGVTSATFLLAETMHSYQDAYDDAFYLDERSRRIHARSELDNTLVTGAGSIVICGFIGSGIGGAAGAAIGAFGGAALSVGMSVVGADKEVHGMLDPMFDDYAAWPNDSEREL